MADAMAKMLVITAGLFKDAGAQTTVAMSAAMVGISAMCIQLGQTPDDDTGRFVPSPDQVLFSCLLTANSTSFNGDGSLMVEFGMDNVIKAMDQFQSITGRSFEPSMNKTLLDVVNDSRNKASSAFAGEYSKFQPQ